MTEENRTEQDAAEESQEPQGAEESTAEANVEPESTSAGFAFGDEAVSSYPNQVKAALEYAAANKYDYGPSIRDADLNWNVISVEPMANDIARVRIGYMPVSGFRGDPGSEYMDVDASGGVLARRQISIPKENSPMVLMGVTAFSVVLAVVLISLMTVFKSDGVDPLYVAGRTLWIRAEEPKQQQYITYTGADIDGTIHNWAMKPDDEADNELVYIKVTLINQTSGTVNIVVDEKSATLLDSNLITYRPIDTISSAYSAESVPKYNVPGFVPLWGSVKLNGSEQVAGMLVFELPRGSSYSELRWAATDSASIKYQ
ncbi:hypothetical protein JYU04_01020 [Dehalococcoides mccartyi]|nr:hypothetical protein [Dehalococcoides mccartyi]